MAARGEGTRAIGALMIKHDNLSVVAITQQCGVEITSQGVMAHMYALVKRGHAVETDQHPRRWSLTTEGRQAIDLVNAARQGLEGPEKTVAGIERAAIIQSRLSVTERVLFPRVALRLLASAALASAKTLDPQLRFACELAIKEAA